MTHTQAITNGLKLRWNWQLCCWEIWNYLSKYNGKWKWFQVDESTARIYANHGVPVSVADTVPAPMERSEVSQLPLTTSQG